MVGYGTVQISATPTLGKKRFLHYCFAILCVTYRYLWMKSHLRIALTCSFAIVWLQVNVAFGVKPLAPVPTSAALKSCNFSAISKPQVTATCTSHFIATSVKTKLQAAIEFGEKKVQEPFFKVAATCANVIVPIAGNEV